jgi:hypothetical protein
MSGGFAAALHPAFDHHLLDLGTRIARSRGKRRGRANQKSVAKPYTRRSTIIFLISAIALAGFKPLGQVCAQFMMVWQR